MFLMYPSYSPSVEDLLPSLDIENLKDPVEFFLAHERLESKSQFVSLSDCIMDGISMACC